MNEQAKYEGSVSERIAALFAQGDRIADTKTLAYYENLVDSLGDEFEESTTCATRHNLKPWEFINYMASLRHVGLVEERITPTNNKDGIANGCTFEFRRGSGALVRGVAA